MSEPTATSPVTPSGAPAVRVCNLAKSYVLQRQRRYLLHDAVRKLALRRKQRDVFWALNDVSFDIYPGDTVAFLGTNGAGKSTLLSIIAGTMAPNRGTVEVRGRIGALLELGAGFHPDLTGRENIELNAALLGMDGAMIEKLMPSIIAFAELEEFIDVPLRAYSSGMQMRLGFSVAIHVDPEILVMDEVFAVGDQRFQRKCIERTQNMIKQGKTVLFVSHSPEAIRRLCRRVIWLSGGRVEMDGPADQVLEAYAKAAG